VALIASDYLLFGAGTPVQDAGEERHNSREWQDLVDARAFGADRPSLELMHVILACRALEAIGSD
jgi:hypothetical protein